MTASVPYGRLFVVSGPSGVGKDAILQEVYARVPGLVQSVSATTRPPRPGEVNGVDYHFVTRDRFEADIERGFFFEHAVYGSHFYGTPLDKIREQRERGLDVVLKIEVQGAQAVRVLAPDAVLIFIQPPSMAELERRLRLRGTDSEERIAQRLAVAAEELAAIPFYDYLLTNDVLAEAVEVLSAIVLAERHRILK